MTVCDDPTETEVEDPEEEAKRMNAQAFEAAAAHRKENGPPPPATGETGRCAHDA